MSEDNRRDILCERQFPCRPGNVPSRIGGLLARYHEDQNSRGERHDDDKDHRRCRFREGSIRSLSHFLSTLHWSARRQMVSLPYLQLKIAKEVKGTKTKSSGTQVPEL